MGRVARSTEVSPLIRGGIFAQTSRASSKPKAQPGYNEIISDYKGLLADLNRAFTETVDKAFPNANFLAEQPGSHIAADTKLSVVLRACYGLSQMQLPTDLVKNYQQTVTKYLKEIQHNPAKNAEYNELRNVLHVYQNLSKAMGNQQLISHELQRLAGLDLPPKTVDRRLKAEWSEPCIQKPIAALTEQVAKTMRSSENLQSIKLAGHSNSLASLSRLVTGPTSRKRSHTEAFTEKRENDGEEKLMTAAPAA